MVVFSLVYKWGQLLVVPRHLLIIGPGTPSSYLREFLILHHQFSWARKSSIQWKSACNRFWEHFWSTLLFLFLLFFFKLFLLVYSPYFHWKMKELIPMIKTTGLFSSDSLLIIFSIALHVSLKTASMSLLAGIYKVN